jgi:uncharacterized protein
MNRHLELAGWRRTVAELYAGFRHAADPAEAHAAWRAGRDQLFREHSQSPLPAGDPLRDTGLPYWPYDARWRLSAPLQPVADGPRLVVPAGTEPDTVLRLIGRVDVPDPVGGRLDVWWLDQYAGGLFIPVRDGTAGAGSYGGGRYLLDTAKGADHGRIGDELVLDFNFLYHPSCRYSPDWVCPLAQDGNRVTARVEAGEQL